MSFIQRATTSRKIYRHSERRLLKKNLGRPEASFPHLPYFRIFVKTKVTLKSEEGDIGITQRKRPGTRAVLGKAQAPRVEASKRFYCQGFLQPSTGWHAAYCAQCQESKTKAAAKIKELFKTRQMSTSKLRKCSCAKLKRNYAVTDVSTGGTIPWNHSSLLYTIPAAATGVIKTFRRTSQYHAVVAEFRMRKLNPISRNSD